MYLKRNENSFIRRKNDFSAMQIMKLFHIGMERRGKTAALLP
jgi:hypothetical protein